MLDEKNKLYLFVDSSDTAGADVIKSSHENLEDLKIKIANYTLGRDVETGYFEIVEVDLKTGLVKILKRDDIIANSNEMLQG